LAEVIAEACDRTVRTALGWLSDSEMAMPVSPAVPVFLTVMVCAALLVPCVWLPKSSEVGVSVTIGARGAVPVPVSATVCGEPLALSATESVAAKLAVEAGVKEIEMVQLEPAASELPQLLVWLKSLGFAPPIVIPEIDSVALPVFLSVAVCAVAVVPVTAEKLSDDGESEAAGAAGFVPVPLNVTVWGEPLASSATESVAVKLAAEAGVKLTEIVQLEPAASELPQLLVWLKSLGFVPRIVTPEIDRAALPVFLSVAVRVALVVPVTWLPKLNAPGVNDAPGIWIVSVIESLLELKSESP
jgi:hypothetical protein